MTCAVSATARGVDKRLESQSTVFLDYSRVPVGSSAKTRLIGSFPKIGKPWNKAKSDHGELSSEVFIMMVVIRSMFSLPHVIDWHCRHRCYRVGDCQPMNLMPVPLLLPVEEPLEPLLPEFELDDPPVELEEEPEPLADPEPDPVEPLPVPVVPPVVPEPVEPPVVPELVEESVPVEPSVDPSVLESVEESVPVEPNVLESVPSLDEPDVESLVLESFEPSVMPGCGSPLF